MTNYRRTRAVVDLNALKRNVSRLRAYVDTPVACVVKANAYGHGAVPVARACLESGASMLCVATAEEALELRQAGIDSRLLVLIETVQGLEELIDEGVELSVSSWEGARALEAFSGRALVHACFNTGMNREGIDHREALALTEFLKSHCELRGVWSHFACADEPLHPSLKNQLSAMNGVLDQLTPDPLRPVTVHMSNSAAAILLPEARFDLVRLGISIYGLHPSEATRGLVELEPVMSVVSEVGLVREIQAGDGVSYGHRFTADADMKIATVSIGYADGFARILSGRADVLVAGKRCRVVGRVTMDTILIDCTGIDVSPGDEVVIVGAQSGAAISADEVAHQLNTISYEVVCGYSARIPRVYE